LFFQRLMNIDRPTRYFGLLINGADHGPL